MADSELLATVKRQYEAIWLSEGWKLFREARKGWDAVIRRTNVQNLNPEALHFLQATNTDVDIQSPELEKDLHDRIAICLADATKIDVVSLDTGKQAKAKVEDLRIFLAGEMLQQDRGDIMSRPLYAGQLRYGFSCFWKPWHMPESADVRDMEAGENLADYAEEVADILDNYYGDQGEHCSFPTGEMVHPLTVAWGPSADFRHAQVYLQVTSMPYVQARETVANKDGDLVRLMSSGDVYFGDKGTELAESDWNGKSVNYLRRAYRDKESGRWKCDEWVWAGQSGQSDQFGAAELVEAYDVPYNHSPFFVCPSGDEEPNEENPHYRYRPMIYPLIVAVNELNALNTLLVMTAVWHIQNPFYVRLDGLSPDLARMIEGLEASGMGTITGAGAERKFVFHVPEPSSGEVMAVPRLEQMPNADLPQSLSMRIQQVQADIERLRANRYLVGDAPQTDTQPATSTLNQAQAAATPFAPYKTNLDQFWSEWLGAEVSAIIYWDEETPKGAQKSYVYHVRGDEPLSREPSEAGDQVEVTADNALIPHDIRVFTSNETMADHQIKQQAADVAHEKGAITDEQWLKMRGDTDDPKHQLDLLDQDRVRKAAAERYLPLRLSYVDTLVQALGHIDLSAVGGQPATAVPQPQGQGVQVPNPGVFHGTAPATLPVGGGNTPNGGMMT